MNEQSDKKERKKMQTTNAGAVPRRRRRPRGLNEWQDLITEQLDEAMAKGAFDNLPGTGRPLRLSEHPNEPADMRMANKLLKDNDLTPAWIGERKKLLAEVEALRATIQRQWDRIHRRCGTVGADREALKVSWSRTVAQWEDQISSLNQRIVDLNITLPIWRMELHRLRLDEELKRVGASRELAADGR